MLSPDEGSALPGFLQCIAALLAYTTCVFISAQHSFNLPHEAD